MKRWLAILLLGVVLPANLGCLAIDGSKTMERCGERVVVVDGEVYIVDLEENTARKVRLIERPATDVTVKMSTSEDAAPS